MKDAMKVARGVASITSEARAIHIPAPAAGPFTAAIIGWGNRRISRIRSEYLFCIATRWEAAFENRVEASRRKRESFMSAPEQNPLPSPVIISTLVFSRSRS